MKKIITTLVIISLLSIANTKAQCPMCKLSAESDLKNGGQAGRGLNAGIFYLLVAPYLLAGTLGFLWWKNNKIKNNNQSS